MCQLFHNSTGIFTHWCCTCSTSWRSSQSWQPLIRRLTIFTWQIDEMAFALFLFFLFVLFCFLKAKKVHLRIIFGMFLRFEARQIKMIRFKAPINNSKLITHLRDTHLSFSFVWFLPAASRGLYVYERIFFFSVWWWMHGWDVCLMRRFVSTMRKHFPAAGSSLLCKRIS